MVKWQELTKTCDTYPKVTMKKTHQPPEPCSTAELEEAIKVLEGRWKILIIFHLFNAPVLRTSPRDGRYLSEDVDSATTRSGKTRHGCPQDVPKDAAQSGVQADKR